MEIIIRGDKIKITDAMSDYINDKLGKLDKYLENSDTVRANVIVKVKNHEQRVEITIPLKTFILRSEESKDICLLCCHKHSEKPVQLQSQANHCSFL